MRIHGQVAICKSEREASKGNKPADNPDLELLAFRSVRKLISIVLAIQSVVLCYSNPGKLIH